MKHHEEVHASQEVEPVRLITPQFALLLAATAAFGISFSAYFLLPKFLAVELAATPATIGGVMAIAMLASVVIMPIIGVHVDRHGRKLFGTFGALIFVTSAVGFLAVDSVGPLLWLLRILQGMAFTCFYISLSTLTTDISPPARLGQAIGLFGAVMISTNAIGPALAEWTANNFNWTVVFGATIVTATLAGALTLLIREPDRVHAHEDSTNMLQVMSHPGMKRILVVAVLTGLTLGPLFTFYQPWALTQGFEQVSSFLIAFAVFAMVVRIGLGSLADRLGRLRVATAALCLYIAAPVSLIWVDIFGLFVCGGLLGLAHGLFFPALNALAVNFARDSERGKAMAAYHGSFNIGFAAGSYLLGFVAMATNYPTIFAIAGISCFIAFMLLATAPRTSNLTA